MGGKKLSMIIGGTGSNRSGNHLFRRWRLRSTRGIPSSAKPLLGWCFGRCICLTYQPSCTPLFGKLQKILLITIMILWNMLHWAFSQNCHYICNKFLFLSIIDFKSIFNLIFSFIAGNPLLKRSSKTFIIQFKRFSKFFQKNFSGIKNLKNY